MLVHASHAASHPFPRSTSLSPCFNWPSPCPRATTHHPSPPSRAATHRPSPLHAAAAPALDTLDVSHNLVVDLQHLLSSLAPLDDLADVSCEGNPAASLDDKAYREGIMKALPLLTVLDGAPAGGESGMEGGGAAAGDGGGGRGGAGGGRERDERIEEPWEGALDDDGERGRHRLGQEQGRGRHCSLA